MARTCKNFLSVILLLLTIFACDKTDVLTSVDKQQDTISIVSSEISIPLAQKWFNQEYLKEQEKTASVTSNNLIREIFWERAYMSKMSNGQDLLIVPIKHHQPEKLANADTYLWIFRDDYNQISAKVIEYLTSVVEKKGDIDITNFSGAMTVRDWNGKLLNGFTFKDGQSVGLLLSVNGVETSRINDVKAGKINGTVCHDVYFTRSTCTSFMYKICENGNCTELKPNDTATYCELYEFRVSQCYWIADFPGQTNPYLGGGISEITARSASQLTIPGFGHSPIDINKFIKCFGVIDSHSTYKITVYADEPFAGTGKSVYGTNVGHTFISLEKNTGGAITRQVVGFYPNAVGGDWVASHMADNGGDSYTVSTTYEPNADGFQKAVTALAKQQSQQYHIAKYNCTTAVAYICDQVGVTFPKNESSFPFFLAKGLSPGQLGKDIRDHQSSGIYGYGGTAPKSKGPCN